MFYEAAKFWREPWNRFFFVGGCKKEHKLCPYGPDQSWRWWPPIMRRFAPTHLLLSVPSQPKSLSTFFPPLFSSSPFLLTFSSSFSSSFRPAFFFLVCTCASPIILRHFFFFFLLSLCSLLKSGERERPARCEEIKSYRGTVSKNTCTIYKSWLIKLLKRRGGPQVKLSF